jgi:tetratricopeptide (TPR) repeat protein
MDQVGADILSRKSIRAALNAWDTSQVLGEHPLATLRVVEARRRAMGRGDTPAGRGLSLRDVLRAAIEELAYDTGEPDYAEKGWRPFIILKEEFIDGRSADYLMDCLHIAQRTYQLERSMAINRLGDTLRQWEDEARDLPEQGSEQGPFLAPPKPVYRLVGRFVFMQELKAGLFSGNGTACHTISGLPGVGKTALAIEAAHDPDVRAHFRDGVLWAGLGQQPDVASHLGRWADALGIGHEVAKSPSVAERAEAIHRAIGARRMLLVIDDAWQLDSALAFRIGGPNCAHLLTTRSPDLAQDFAEAGARKLNELSDAAGLVLFGQLAPGVAEQEPDEAQALVRAVGGLPLAIILMARFVRREARKGPLPLRAALEELREAEARFRLEQPLAPLERHPSLPAGVQISLRAAIQITERALTEPARQALHALSVFAPKPNTFSREAALVVGATSAETLETLLDAGLVEGSGPDRYSLHQAIADYARLALEEGAPLERLASFFTAYLQSHKRAYDELDLEANNIQAALDAAHRCEMQAELVLATNSYAKFLAVRGLTHTAQALLERAREAAAAAADTHALAATLLNLGRVAYTRGENARAEQLYREALNLARESEATDGLVDALQGLGWIAQLKGEYALAKDYYHQGLVLARQQQDPERIGSLLKNLGAIATNENDPDLAKVFLLEGLSLARQAAEIEAASTLLQNLGAIAEREGDYAQAERYWREGLELARQIGHRDVASAHLQSLGVLASRRGDTDRAREFYRESLALAREIGHRARICLLLINFGVLETELGNYEQAESYYSESLVIARELGHRERTSILLANLGDLATKRGEYVEAEQYYTESLAIAREIGHGWLTTGILVEWADSCLSQQRWDAAEAALDEALPMARKANLQEFVGRALFGLAKIAHARGDIAGARRYGRESLDLLEQIGHKTAAEAREWLARLPTPGAVH